MGTSNAIPKWQREMKEFIGIKSMIILEGNINDIYPIYSGPIDKDGATLDGFDTIDQAVLSIGEMGGKLHLVFYDPIYGFYGYDGNVKAQEKALLPYLEGYQYSIEPHLGGRSCFQITGKDGSQNPHEQNSKKYIWMSEIIRRAMTQRIENTNNGQEADNKEFCPPLFVLNFASRIEQGNPGPTSSNEMFLNLLAASRDAIRYDGLRTGMILLVDKYNDIPAWVYLNNPCVRNISVTPPDMKERRELVHSFIETPWLSTYAQLGNKGNEYGDQLVAQTEGYMCKEVRDVLELAASKDIQPKDIQDALQMYKYGVQDNPWNELDQGIEKRVHDTIARRVKGQNPAAETVEAVTMRAIQGMSGLTHSNHSSKPRGILFFLGPTGVGKTEMAKSLAEALFYDENTCLRFDMSEYSAEQADQKLFGAPPGYIGYEGGGQLTNAVKNHPFSILLFDEIEKAHPSIWYKFLQILEDGRMTDNQGTTVYFGETLIIFTSNVGMTKPKLIHDGNGNAVYARDRYGSIINELAITIDDPMTDDSSEFQAKVESVLKNAAKEYFQTIGPEVLNRIGEENIVVFRFITVEAAREICCTKMGSICKAIMENKGIMVNWQGAKEYLINKAISVRENGGRGVGNMLESVFLNPLVKYLGKQAPGTPHRVIASVSEEGTLVFSGD